MIVVGALAAFVGVQVFTRPTHKAPPAADARRDTAAAPVSPRAGSARVTPAAASLLAATPADVNTITTRSADPPPARNPDDIRARIAGATGTYIGDMVDDLNGQLVRWPDRRQQGLRIWVQSNSAVHDWDLRYTQMARDAFADWSDGLPARLDFVLDSATSDIRIVWLDRFPPDAGQRIGSTARTNDQNGWIVAAQIAVAVHDSAGRTLQPSDLAGVVRHEAGHALGLGHSKDPNSKMYPLEMVHVISPADRATLRLLYQLPPGSIR